MTAFLPPPPPPDTLGDSRTDYPMASYLISGTQSENGKENYFILRRTTQEEEEEDSMSVCLCVCPSL